MSGGVKRAATARVAWLEPDGRRDGKGALAPVHEDTELADGRRHLGVPRDAADRGRRGGTVLFYGDSLTWGMAHSYTGRYDHTWPRLIKDRLKVYNLRVVESALCSRTTRFDDSGNSTWLPGCEPSDFNGMRHFTAEFMSCEPDWLVLLLGTNDLKARIRSCYELQENQRGRWEASPIANNVGKIAELGMELFARNPSKLPNSRLKVIVVAPPVIYLTHLAQELGYDSLSLSISQDFSRAFEAMALKKGLDFVQCDTDMQLSVDGIHLTPPANVMVAQAVWSCMRKSLGEPPLAESSKKCKRRKRRKRPKISSRASVSSSSQSRSVVSRASSRPRINGER